MRQVKKAIIPAAGLGTRFLPATKTVPKEMLNIVDKPIILYVVEEAVKAGIEDVILIAGRGKSAIEDFFDCTYELEDHLEKSGKTDLLERIKNIKNMANIISIRQKSALGLGHAVLCGQPVVGDDPFAVLLGDEIMCSETNAPTVIGQLIEKFNESQLSTVAVMTVNPSEVSKYGIIEPEEIDDGQYRVLSVVEKPKPEIAPSCLALPGRYVFDSQIFHYLKRTSAGVGGEIQLTDGMNDVAREIGMRATKFKAKRYDAGDKMGYLMANIELALENKELSLKMRDYIKSLAQQL